MRVIKLPSWTAPVGPFDLVRLGRDRDGGYLVDSRDVAQAEVLISLGVNDDWSFERDFLRRRNVPLHAYDGTVDRGVLGKRLVKALLTRKELKHQFEAWRDYEKFFTGSRHHHMEMVGLTTATGYVSLEAIMDKYGGGKVFLKIDVEGWEYRLLDDILENADRFCGLVIEFHDVDLHQRRIEDFVQRLPLRVAHVHCNSFAPSSDDGTPHVIEVTFSSHAPHSGEPVELPHRLDRLSAPYHEPYAIRFTAV